MDVHRELGDVTEEDIRAAHARDLAVQDKFGVHFLTFWFNQPDGRAFCLVEAPNKESAIACHKHSHGLVPHDMIEVERPTVGQFMGDWEANIPEIARIDGPGSPLDSGLRAIMFTDLEGSTAISSQDGDRRAMEVIERHDAIVRAALTNAVGARSNTSATASSPASITSAGLWTAASPSSGTSPESMTAGPAVACGSG